MCIEVTRTIDGPGGNPLRVCEDNSGTPWFVAVDINRAIGAKSSSGYDYVSQGEKKLDYIKDVDSQSRYTMLLSPLGVYQMLGCSTKPAARRFTAWMNSNVFGSGGIYGRVGAGQQTPDASVFESARRAPEFMEESKDGFKADAMALFRRYCSIVDELESALNNAVDVSGLSDENAEIVRELAARLER